MGWIKDDEYILLMDFEPDGGRTSGMNCKLDELKRLRDAGIQTGVKYVYWGKNEPIPGEYTWWDIDEWVERYRQADMKLLLSVYTDIPMWIHNDWRAMNANHQTMGSISIWNREAQAASDRYIQALVERYDSDMVLAWNSWITNGETFYHNEPAWFDIGAQQAFREYAGANAVPRAHDEVTERWMKETYINHMVRLQKIFASTPHKEIWTAAHRMIARFHGLYGNGCQWIGDVYDAYQSAIPGCIINVIQYTYHPHGVDYLTQMIMDTERYGIRVWGGAEYCEGLPVSVPTALRTKARGLILSPIHPFTGHKKVDDWMIGSIQNAIAQFKEAR